MHLNEQSRLLITNEEKVLYSGNLHAMYGIKWMLLSILCLALATLIAATGWLEGEPLFSMPRLIPVMILLLGGIICWIIYAMPFWRTFFVVTDERAIIGFGQFTIKEEQILPYQMEDWEIQENYLETLLGYGHLTLRLIEGRQLRIIHIPYLKKPHMFTRYLDEISPIRSRTENVMNPPQHTEENNPKITQGQSTNSSDNMPPQT